jgi:hypothetical protein
LQVHSVAPGTYTVFDYGKNLRFHGKFLPDHITTYVAGAQVVDADLEITDAPPDNGGLVQTPEMIANGRPTMALRDPLMMPMYVPVAGSTGTIQPVIIHADLDSQGNVLDLELSATADPRLNGSAFDTVKKLKLGRTGASQAYVRVSFVPASPPQ